MKYGDLGNLLSAALPTAETHDNGDGTFTHYSRSFNDTMPSQYTMLRPRNWIFRVILKALDCIGIDAWGSFLAESDNVYLGGTFTITAENDKPLLVKWNGTRWKP